MKSNVIAVSLVCAAMVATMTGCSQSGNSSGSATFGYSQPAVDPFQSAESKGVIAQYKKLGYATLPATNANGSPSQQLADVKTLVNQGAKGIVMSVLDAEAIIPAIKYANSKNVPVVAIDEAPHGGKLAMIVRADNVGMGKLACEQMGKRLTSGQTVLSLDGDPTSANGRDRTNGFNDCMKASYPGIKVTHVSTKWNPATAAAGLQTAFNQNPDIAGVYVQSDAVFYPTVLDTMKKMDKAAKVGEAGHVVIVSIDGTPGALNALRSGVQDAVVEQPLTDYIKYGVYYATEASKGKTFKVGATDHDSTIETYHGNLADYLPTPIITKDNADDTANWGNLEFAKQAFGE